MKVLFVRSGNVGEDPLSDRQAKAITEKGIDVSAYSIVGKGFFGYLRNLNPLRDKIKEESPDLIHAHFGMSGILASLANKKQKLVVSFMGDDILGSNRADGSITVRSKLIAGINRFFANSIYDLSIVKSDEMLNKIRIHNVVVIPNGVDLQLYKNTSKHNARNSLHINDNARIVLFVSDPRREEKNYQLAEEAIKIQNDLGISLMCIYNITQEELINYYNAADLVLLTSYHEGSPNVVKEAMACNCPVVSTDVGDVKWLFGEVEGYYITSFNPKDVADKVKKALEFREKHKLTKGRDRVIRLGLDSESIADRIINVYNQVLDVK